MPSSSRLVFVRDIAVEHLTYNKEDLDATWRLYLGSAAEWNRHPFMPIPAPQVPPNSPPEAPPEFDPETLVATRAYSPASIGKAYLRAMGIRPRLKVQADFSKEILGYSMVAYYGGRTECHIRRQIVPVTYLDVLSMYPTVCTLMGLWRHIIADRVEVDEATDEARSLLDNIGLDDLYKAETWGRLVILAEVFPEDDVLPVRGQYEEDGDYQIGVNIARSATDRSLWYMLPDLVASKLLTGKTPRLRRAVRFRPDGVQPGLRPTTLLGDVAADPRRQDFFQVLIEKRHEFQEAAEAEADKVRARYFDTVQRGLKIIANATSYGIFAEVDDKVTGAKQAQVHGLWQFPSPISQEEHPGPYAFPPLAALVTSAARLMLAMVELELKANQATYAFCDTDSVAIVGDPDVVRTLRDRFALLTPYGFAGHLLKLEAENTPHAHANVDPRLYCYSISAKRYVLFNVGDDGRIIIRKASEHGLGHLLSPSPKREDQDWMQELWEAILKQTRGEVREVGQALPFATLPALGRFPITRPSILKRFTSINTTRDPKTRRPFTLPYAQQVKPFNFMLVAFPDTGDITTGGEAYWPGQERRGPFRRPTARQPIRPIAPFELDPRMWRRLRWVDLHTGRPVSLSWSAEPTYLETETIRVQTYRDVVRRHLTRPESKAAGPGGEFSGPNTMGELQRLQVLVEDVMHIGKESHELEEVQAWLTSPSTTYVHYPDERVEWQKVLNILRQIPRAHLAKMSGLHVRSIKAILNTSRLPHRKHQRVLHEIAEKLRRLDAGLVITLPSDIRRRLMD